MNGNFDNVHKSNVAVILGAQWGDEGKGKIIDYLIKDNAYDVVARCQGGNNAGHTVSANGKNYDFHLLPCGMPIKGCLNLIGNGVVVNLDALFEELKHNGIIDDPDSDWENRLFISDRAHLVLRVHMLVDGQQENSLDNKSKIGTTQRGIGPTYSSKCFRNGLRVADLLGNFDEFSLKYHILIQHYKKQFANIEINEEDELSHLKDNADRLRKLNIVVDTASFLYKLRNEGKSILVEGANGALLDIDFGTYPYVTSSNATVGGACTGLGLPPTSISSVIGVVKAYQTRVGTGPFPTELLNSDGIPDEIGSKLQAVGHEWGVTTGRKRRCGWLDLVLLRYATIINGFTVLALTKVDILDTFEKIKVAIGYTTSDGRILLEPPAKASDWTSIKVKYETFPGWMTSTTCAREYTDLPKNCRNYIKFIESFVRVPISLIGVGKSRECLIIKQNC